jgi:hypothetical protein
MDIMTRRMFLGSVPAVPAAILFTTDVARAATPHDAVLETIFNEIVALNGRATSNPTPEMAREYATLARVVDSVAAAHGLKRLMKRVQNREVDASTIEQLAKRLRAHGVAANGDDMLRKHFESMAQFSDAAAVKRAALDSITSGLMFQHQAAAFEALVPDAGASGAQFRERLRGPAIDLWLRRTAPSRACEAASGWGAIFDTQGVLLMWVPPLEWLALASAILGAGFAIYHATYC